jgi:hypothetical protein
VQGSLGYLSGRFFSGQLIQCFGGTEVQGFSRASGHTGRLPSFLHTIHAKMAFLHPAVMTELGDAERTCHLARMTPDALVLVNHHNAVGRPFLYGAGGAGGFAGRYGAVQTAMGYASVQHLGELPFPDIKNHPPFHPRLNAVQTLTGNFTGMALDASLSFEIDSILFQHTGFPRIQSFRYDF